jgi:hypothetical protein
MESPDAPEHAEHQRQGFITSVASYLATLEMLLEDMCAAVIGKRHVPLDEVRGWRFARLARAFEQVRRATFDEYISDVRTVEFGVSRALAPMFSKKKVPALPTSEKAIKDGLFDAVSENPLDQDDVRENGVPNFMKKYMEANKLEQ